MSQEKGDEVIELGEVGEIAIKVPEPDNPCPKFKINWSTIWKPEWHYPIFTISISLLQIVLFYSVKRLTLIPLFANDPYRRHEVWRLVTVCLPHDSWLHVWQNIVMQLITGILIEVVYSWRKVSTIYFLSQIGASLFVSLLTPSSYSWGASGADFGLLAAHLVVIIYNWRTLGWRRCRLFWLLLFLVGFSGGRGLLEWMINGADAGSVAHLGGAVTGFLVSILILGRGTSDGDQFLEKKMQFVSKCCLLFLLVLIVGVNVAFSGLYFDTEWNFEYLRTFTRFSMDWHLNLFQNSYGVGRCGDSDLECKNRVDMVLLDFVNSKYDN